MGAAANAEYSRSRSSGAREIPAPETFSSAKHTFHPLQLLDQDEETLIAENLSFDDELSESDEGDHPTTEYPQPALSIDPIELYLKEMSQVPLLTFEEEVELAKRIILGRQSQEQSNKHNGFKENKAAIESAILDGQQAREHLIKANTRLVVSIAKRYVGQGVPFLDLIQEGNLGLMKAVEKYDYKRGFRFSTYATWWIRQTISRSVAEQGRTIRLPVHMVDRIRKMYRIAREIEQTTGQPATVEELAEVMELNTKRIQWMVHVSWLPLSLESPLSDDEETEFGMFIEDPNTPTPPQVTYQNMLMEKIEEILATLTVREARILRLRYGLEDGHTHTLEEVGRKFGLTRERIRQIEHKALRRLRQPYNTRQLRDYL